MSVFIDTSALFALLDASDVRHREAARIWAGLLDSDADLVTHNYVIVETAALVQRRMGEKLLEPLFDGLLPLVRIIWIEEELHRRALAAFRSLRMSGPSLVDCVSFEIIRQRGEERAFAFDRHFEEQGFTVLKA
jgi:predicted nucleic acid-binding protein